ncbi:MAG TPA: antibiotic biosynthesis monooxygenase [Candidatus Thioglobus sp.]|nr:antibiotic biosynthesis monooxygenase [Candidatus Thioglobus sp.]
MYAVIFTAEIGSLDEQYYEKAKTMREIALNQYHCQGFNSTFEGNTEVSISYWSSLDDIKNFKNDSSHQEAQMVGKSKWYKSYSVEVTKVIRQYSYNNS